MLANVRQLHAGYPTVGDIHVGVNTWLRFPSLATQVQRVLDRVDDVAIEHLQRDRGHCQQSDWSWLQRQRG